MKHGDCLEVLRSLPSNSMCSLVTDPPAGISFMGKDWDHHKGGRDQWIAWMTEVMTEAMRVLKPGAHGLVWALPRTSHWTATALENAGFEVRDVVHHAFGTGFPKSHNIYKSLTSIGVDAEKWRGYGTALKPSIERWILCRKPTASEELLEKTDTFNAQEWDETFLSIETLWNNILGAFYRQENMSTTKTVSSLITELRTLNCLISLSIPRLTILAKTAQGGDLFAVNNAIESLSDILEKSSALKIISAQENVSSLVGTFEELIKKSPKIGNVQSLEPLFEDYILVRKPCSEKTVAANVLKHGCGGINIDGCRIGTDENLNGGAYSKGKAKACDIYGDLNYDCGDFKQPQGRFPANLVLDEAAAEMLDEQSGELGRSSGGGMKRDGIGNNVYSKHQGHEKIKNVGHGDTGGASRFFKCFSIGNDCDIDTEWLDQRHSKTANLAETSSNLEEQHQSFALEAVKTFFKNDHRLNHCLGSIPDSKKCTLLQNLASHVDSQGNIDTIEIIQSLLRLSGFVLPATGENISKVLSDPITESGQTRFLYCPKASKADRNAGLEGMPEKSRSNWGSIQERSSNPSNQNFHPTVKSTKLMEYLITLVTPPGGTVLDPFMGSGSTGVAAKKLGMQFYGIEQSAEYFEIAVKRIG